jgi:hypothetical protein
MSWGYKIAILYIGFVMLILTLVGVSSGEKVDLVSADYYEQELKFQNKLDDSKRSNELEQPLEWIVVPGAIKLKFPKEFKGRKTEASVYLLRPSDSKMDKTIKVLSDTTTERLIATDKVIAGIYKMEISWEAEGQKYYNEGVIHIK